MIDEFEIGREDRGFELRDRPQMKAVLGEGHLRHRVGIADDDDDTAAGSKDARELAQRRGKVSGLTRETDGERLGLSVKVRGPVCLVIVLLFCAFGGVARAAIRYAAPNGGFFGDCTSSSVRCDLGRALSQAQAGDEVVIGTGTYPPVGGELTVAPASVSVHGEFDKPMPRITYVGTLGAGVALKLAGSGDSLTWVEIVSETQQESALSCGTLAVIQRVRAITTKDSARPIVVNKTCDVVDSLAGAYCAGTAGILVGSGVNNGSSTIRNTTAVGLGSGSNGIEVLTDEGEAAATVEVSNTIAAGAYADLFSYGESSTIAIEHSNFEGTLTAEGGTIIDPGNNQKAQPLFVNAAAGDFTEAAGSPTIDAGTVLSEYITPTLDLAGNPRIVNGAIDIGAFEFVPQPTLPALPSGSPSPTPPSSARAVIVLSSLKISPNAFRATSGGGGKKSAAHGATVTYSLSADAAVTLEVERKASGRKAGGHCVKLSKGNAGKPKCPLYTPIKGALKQTGKRGPNSFAFNGRVGGKPLAVGTYRLVGAVGASSARAGFTILE
jgi:hypothetical protein